MQGLFASDTFTAIVTYGEPGCLLKGLCSVSLQVSGSATGRTYLIEEYLPDSACQYLDPIKRPIFDLCVPVELTSPVQSISYRP